MKVLFYNWCPLEETEGGGIAVYQRNLLDYIAAHDVGIEPFFLCSGFYYDGGRKAYIREEAPNRGARVFSVVNSPVYAPMRAPDVNFKTMVEDETLTPVIDAFLKTQGPFAAIHFQTLEGLPLKVLSLREKYPDTKFIYSVHNYTAICPNVMLWTEDNENCQARACQDRCDVCMARYNRPGIRFLKTFRRLLEGKHDRLYYYTRGVKFVTRGYFPKKRERMPDIYRKYVAGSVRAINDSMDSVLAVSERVRDIMALRGIDERLLRVSYIGTKFAERARAEGLTDADATPFGIVYMGYMRREKGFYFLLEALEKLDAAIAADMSVTFASKVTDRSAAKRIENLKQKFSRVRLYDGYKHDQIPEILEGAHLGVVPVLWEDNLPQVAIEMISCGVPVLSSSFGGASELNASGAFRFDGGDMDDFTEKLVRIYRDRNLLRDYWQQRRRLTTMDDHVRALAAEYGVVK